jgi:hypothetical protein
MTYAMLSRKSEAAQASHARAGSKTASNSLRIGELNDSFEHEADRVTDEVIAGRNKKRDWSLAGMSVGTSLPRKGTCGGSGDLEGECEECQEKKTLQRKAVGSTQTGYVPPIVDQVLSSPGRLLDTVTRRFFEQRFGHSFDNVRVHTDAQAASSADAIAARAYTAGTSIVFGEGQYAPQTTTGRRLLAHELTHVVQQDRSIPVLQGGLGIASDDDPAEREAKSSAWNVNKISVVEIGKGIQREPTRPRAATASESVADVSMQTASPPSGQVTAGSLARQEWESLFKRHFTEPDKVMGKVESSHARYLYSRIYGWIDAQHFFAHIQYAEDKGLEGATAEGIGIEKNQQLGRIWVSVSIGGGESAYRRLLKKNLTPHDLGIALEILLWDWQKYALVRGFSKEQFAKFIIDNAMSAWSYEDLVSNQLGVQFFRSYGSYVNGGANPHDVRKRFVEKVTEYFKAIQVVDDPSTVKRLAARLPGRERWTAPKLSESQVREKFPELFEFKKATHQIRVAVYDSWSEAYTGKAAVEKAIPAVLPPGLNLTVEPFGRRFALFSGPMSHFEAVVYKVLIDHAVQGAPGGALVEPIDSFSESKP